MLGVFAEFERATIIDRVIAGMERKAAQGGWCGGHEPFGYRAVKGEGRLDVDEAEAPVIAVDLRPLRNKRLGAHAIANWLNEAGLRTRAGSRGRIKAVLTVLRNRTYLGEVHFRGTWSEASHPPLVEEGLRCRPGHRSRSGVRMSPEARFELSDYLLTGLVVCAGCGRHFSGTRATGRNATYRYYTCGGRQRYGRRPVTPTGSPPTHSTMPSCASSSPPTRTPICSPRP